MPHLWIDHRVVRWQGALKKRMRITPVLPSQFSTCGFCKTPPRSRRPPDRHTRRGSSRGAKGSTMPALCASLLLVLHFGAWTGNGNARAAWSRQNLATLIATLCLFSRPNRQAWQKVDSSQFLQGVCRCLSNRKESSEVGKDGILSPVRLPFRHFGCLNHATAEQSHYLL